MKYRVVPTLIGKIIIDEITRIKPNDYYVAWEDNYEIPQWIIYVLVSGLNGKTPCKIIGTINHSINKNIAMVIVEDEVERLADEYSKSFIDAHGTEEVDFIAGYKKKEQEGVYSEKDMQLCWQQAIRSYIGKESTLFFDQYIQSLKQEYIELETEEYGTTMKDFKDVNYRIKTNRVNGQLMAYVKKLKL